MQTGTGIMQALRQRAYMSDYTVLRMFRSAHHRTILIVAQVPRLDGRGQRLSEEMRDPAMNQWKGVKAFRPWMSVRGAVIPLALGLMLAGPAAMPASANNGPLPECNPGVVVTPDADGDGITDDIELQYGTDPNVADMDGDGLTDYDELVCGTSSAGAADTDGDGAPDGAEIDFGSDPLDVSDFPYAQAGPEPDEVSASEAPATADDDVATVTSLPSTGAGSAAPSSSSMLESLSAILTGAGAALGSVVLRRRSIG
jgi:hypothetical protein